VLDVQLAADRAPDLVLGLGVLDGRRRLAGRPGQRGGGDVVAARLVDGVVEAGVILAEVDLHRAVVGLLDR
jgi:hypothetical protein